MKCTNVIALVMVLVGVNLITFATTRYWTTKYVLTNAQDRMDSGLKSNGLLEQVYTSGPSRVTHAISLAGGWHYWWNNAIPYWAAGGVLVISGIAVTRYKPQVNKANKS